MSSTPNPPQPTDAPLGNNTSTPSDSEMLGGMDVILQKLASADLNLRLEALEQAWAYGALGRALLEDMLADQSKILRRRARWLLRQPQGSPLTPEPVWNLTERLCDYSGYYNSHAIYFANRRVRDFSPSNLRTISPEIAYALRCKSDEAKTIAERLEALLEQPNSNQIEAIVIGLWDNGSSMDENPAQSLVNLFVEASERLPNIKAIFIGDITSRESEISWLVQSDMSPLLQAYPQLEILQVRGGEKLSFANAGKHNHLQALILETGGLSCKTVHQVCAWQFPALQHLELWFGSEHYGGDCSVEDLQPILTELCFPNLTYLGLRNSSFTNELMGDLVRSPLLNGLQVLDLSLGTLGDEGATQLLECAAIRDLEILHVSESYLSVAMIDQLSALGIDVDAAEQREEDDDYEDLKDRRYCAVAE